jgi:hypothetical protein
MANGNGKGLGNAAALAAAAFTIALLAILFFLWQPGREVSTGSPANEAITPKAQVTPDLNGNTVELQRPAPPDTAGSGPNSPQTR